MRGWHGLGTVSRKAAQRQAAALRPEMTVDIDKDIDWGKPPVYLISVGQRFERMTYLGMPARLGTCGVGRFRLNFAVAAVTLLTNPICMR